VQSYSTPFAADNRLVQRLQSSVCPYRVHAAAWTSPNRNSSGFRLVGHMFSLKLSLSFRDRHPHVTHCSSGQAHSSSQTAPRSVQPVFVWAPNAMLYNALSVGKKPPPQKKKNFPFGFRHPTGEGPSHSHSQHAQNSVKIERIVPEISSTDIHTQRQTHTQTCS